MLIAFCLALLITWPLPTTDKLFPVADVMDDAGSLTTFTPCGTPSCPMAVPVVIPPGRRITFMGLTFTFDPPAPIPV